MHEVPERMRVRCAKAAYRSVTPDTSDAWTDAIAHLSARHEVCARSWSGDALISRARCVVASAFLDLMDLDVLCWVDADITWRLPRYDYEGDLIRIIRSAYRIRGIVGGAYSKRAFGQGFSFQPNEQSPREFRTGDDLVFPVATVAAGFMAIHRDALTTISKTLPYVSDENGTYQPFCLPFLALHAGGLRYLSEDQALCHRAHANGVPVMLDAMPVLGHQGDHIFTAADAYRRPA